MLRPRLAALLCLLALLAPAGAVLAQALEPQSSCVDNCCSDDGCGGESDENCPDGCPDCSCSAAARIAVPVPELAAPAPHALIVAVLTEPSQSPADGCPRGVLHVPRG